MRKNNLSHAVAMAADHEAFRNRLEQNPNYERREEPTLADVARVLGEISQGVDDFKSTVNNRIDQIETRRARPGQEPTDDLKENKGGPTIFDAPEFKVMRADADFEQHYAQKARARKNNLSGDDVKVSLGGFCRAVANMRTSEEVKASLAVGTDSAGGFAVPDRLMHGILSAMTPASSLMQAGAGIVDVSTSFGAKSWRTAVIDTLPTASWRDELGTVPESEPTFRSVDATPQSLAFIVRVSRELLADAVNMDTALQVAIGQAMAKEIDRAGLRGSGTAPEIRGILNTTGVNAVNQGANGAVIASYTPILAGMLAIRKNNAPKPRSTITSPDALFKFAGLTDTTDQPLQMPEILRDIKWHDTTQIPVNLVVGTSTDCTEIHMGDYTGLYYLMRENVSIRLLQEKYAGTGEVGFLCHARLDLVIPYPKQFTVVKGSRIS